MKTGIKVLCFGMLLGGLYACGLLQGKDKDIKLYVMDCGTIQVRDISVFSPGVDKGVSKTLTNSCYLIKHPKGNLLWDTGLTDSIGPEGIDKWEGAFHLSVENPLLTQLSEIGVSPADIDFMGISHFHFDHSGNANAFTQSQLIIQQAEFDAAFGPDAEKFGFAPDTYNALDKNKTLVIKGDHDVFADGSVLIKAAPGHTPGHQVLYLDLPETGPLLLSGDLYHFTKNRINRRVPSFNFNKEQTLAAMEEIETFVSEKNAGFWIQHDLEQNQKIKHSPAFYR